jgi:hypothetical protein
MMEVGAVWFDTQMGWADGLDQMMEVGAVWFDTQIGFLLFGWFLDKCRTTRNLIKGADVYSRWSNRTRFQPAGYGEREEGDLADC